MNIFSDLSIFILHSLAMAEDLPDASFAKQQASDPLVGLWNGMVGLSQNGYFHKVGVSNNSEKCHFTDRIIWKHR